MAKDVQETVRDVLRAIEGSSGNGRGKSNNGLSGVKGVAAGAGAAALVPLAVKGAGRLVKGISTDGLGSIVHAPQEALHDIPGKFGDRLGSSLGDKVSDKVDEAGGPKGILKGTVKDALPFGGSDDDDEQGGGNTKGGAPGTGKGRRMPVQQDMDIGVNIETVYNQFTQYEDWSNFMHRVVRVTQGDDPTEVKFQAKIWTRTRDFTAKIETQRPDERIKWSVSEGLDITGVVTFHELGPNLTKVLLTMDVQPGGMVEKMARGMRHIKRAARGDLHRFKAFIEMTEHETGAWRGVIEDGEVVEDHDPSYDETREYADRDEVLGQQDEDEDEEQQDEDDEQQDEDDEQQDEDDEQQDDEQDEAPRRRGRSTSRATSNRSGSQSRSTGSRSGGSSRSSSGSSRSSSGSGSGSGSGSRSRSRSGGSSRSRSSASSSGGQTRRRQSRSRNGHNQ
jgi:uncharacterized membrane protein